MDAETIVKYTNLPIKEVEYWVGVSSLIVYNDKKYIAALHKLNIEYLQKTLPLVHEVYDEHLDSIKARLQENYEIDVRLMTASTLSDWVIGVLRYPESAYELRGKHKRIIGAIFRDSLQDLIDILEQMPEATTEWQQALCMLAFPLMKR